MKKLVSFAGIAVICALFIATASAAPAMKDRQEQIRALNGHVLNHQEQPIARAIVYLKNTKSLVVTTYITEGDGGFRFPALSPNVDYEVYAEFQGARSDVKTLSSFDNRKQANMTLKIK